MYANLETIGYEKSEEIACANIRNAKEATKKSRVCSVTYYFMNIAIDRIRGRHVRLKLSMNRFALETKILKVSK